MQNVKNSFIYVLLACAHIILNFSDSQIQNTVVNGFARLKITET